MRFFARMGVDIGTFLRTWQKCVIILYLNPLGMAECLKTVPQQITIFR